MGHRQHRSHFQCHHQLQILLGSPSTHAHMVATVAARLTATARMATTSIGGKFALEVLSTESKAGAAMVPGSVPVAVMEAVRARGPAFGALTYVCPHGCPCGPVQWPWWQWWWQPLA